AIERGASAVICAVMPAELDPAVTYVRVPSTADALGVMADNFHDRPSTRLMLVGITGTNGKTSVATLLHGLHRALGLRAGLIGTVEVRIGRERIPATHTTPDAIRLNELLARMV